MPKPTIAMLQADLEERYRRIAELKDELEQERDLTYRLAEQVRDSNDTIDSWIQAFDMVQSEEGAWVWKESFAEGQEWLVKYVELQRKWNKHVELFNAKLGYGRNVGRPLGASEAQQQQVLKLHKVGHSLREIAEEMSLSLRTVRTVLAKGNGVDRTTIKHLERIDPERAKVKAWEAKRQIRARLPKRIHQLRKTGDELLKEAKDLARR
jgi:Helix-turn-helix domain of resolvase